MRHFNLALILLAVAFSAFPFCSHAEKVPAPATEDTLQPLLKIYAKLTKRKVWVALGVESQVQMELPPTETVKVAEALKELLLEKAGIVITETGSDQAFADYVHPTKGGDYQPPPGSTPSRLHGRYFDYK